MEELIETFEEMFDVELEAERSGTVLVENPFPIWAKLLAQAPVHRGSMTQCMGLPGQIEPLSAPGFEYFSVFSFAAASEAFTRKADFDSSFYHDIGTPNALGDNILFMDGLRHRRYRDLIQEFFQPAAASTWWREKIVNGLVDDLIGGFAHLQEVDLNSQFFALLPMQTVTTGFGLSKAQGADFRRYIQIALSHVATGEQKLAALNASDRILEEVIVARQSEPQDDMISRLTTARLEEEDGKRRPLTVKEIVDFCRLIVFAGGGTTWKQLGITLFALLNNRDQLEALMADRSLMQNTILESARWDPNDPIFTRKAVRDTELQGVAIPKGAALHICLSAANRDPSRWEDPHTFDIFRPVQRSLAFAAGPHSCLGQHVARQEISVALNALFDHFPSIRWNPDRPPARIVGSLMSRGPGPLHVLLR